MLTKKKKDIEGKEKLVVIATPQSLVSEQFRRLRTNINFSSLNQEIKSLLIASASVSEGKSWVAANLAAVYAQEGKKVLLVDSDLRNPTAHETFQMQNDIGISSVLNKKTTVEAGVKKTFIDNLDLLSGGPIPDNPAELLASEAMDSLMDQVKKNYDLVIYDSPPILEVVDGQILANKCDKAILVINSGKTGREAAIKAKEAITLSNGKLAGVVLNNFSSPMKINYP